MRPLSLHVSTLDNNEYTFFTYSFADLVSSDAPLTTDDNFEKYPLSPHAWLHRRYPDLPVTNLNHVSISLSSPGATFLTTMPDSPFVLLKSKARHQPYQGSIFCHLLSCFTCSQWSTVGQQPRFRRFMLTFMFVCHCAQSRYENHRGQRCFVLLSIKRITSTRRFLPGRTFELFSHKRP